MTKYNSIAQILEDCSIETENKWNNLLSKDIENIINDMLFETVEMKKKKTTDEIKDLIIYFRNDREEYYHEKIMRGNFYQRALFIHCFKYKYVDNEDNVYCRYYYKLTHPKVTNGIEIMKMKYTVKDLKQSCKTNKLKKYSRLRRNELIRLLMTI